MTKPSVDPGVVVHALGEWLAFDGALFRRLASALAAAVERGDLPPGRCLPSERALAPRLSVSRGTVVAAYGELAARGLVERRRGSGTWVAGTAAAPVVDMRDYAAGIRSRRLTARSLPGGDGVIDLGVSILLDADGVPDRALRLDRAELGRASAGHGYQPLGVMALRRRLAELHTAAGLPTTADQIAVTGGAQHAIALAARLLVRPGSEVVVESPTYPGAIDAFTRAGASVVTVATDGAGARVDAVARMAPSARLAYVMPSCHNPMGTVMPEGRRRALAAVADAGDMWVVEDATLSHLVFDGRPALPVAAYATGDRVLTIGSLSKLVWGGLRVGWLRGPARTVHRLARLRAAEDFGNATPSQLMAVQALDDVERLAAERRRTFAARAELAASLLRRLLPAWEFVPPAGGLSIWARLPAGTAEGFSPVAARHGVAFLPGGAASADDAHPDHLRLSFAPAPERLEEGIRRLARAWDDYAPQAVAAPPASSLG